MTASSDKAKAARYVEWYVAQCERKPVVGDVPQTIPHDAEFGGPGWMHNDLVEAICRALLALAPEPTTGGERYVNTQPDAPLPETVATFAHSAAAEAGEPTQGGEPFSKMGYVVRSSDVVPRGEVWVGPDRTLRAAPELCRDCLTVGGHKHDCAGYANEFERLAPVAAEAGERPDDAVLCAEIASILRGWPISDVRVVRNLADLLDALALRLNAARAVPRVEREGVSEVTPDLTLWAMTFAVLLDDVEQGVANCAELPSDDPTLFSEREQYAAARKALREHVDILTAALATEEEK